MLSNSHRPAAVGAFKTLSRELGKDGILLNSVAPGRIATDRIASMAGTPLEELRSHPQPDIPVGRLGEPRRVRRRDRVPVLGARVLRDRRQPDGRRRADARRLVRFDAHRARELAAERVHASIEPCEQRPAERLAVDDLEALRRA